MSDSSNSSIIGSDVSVTDSDDSYEQDIQDTQSDLEIRKVVTSIHFLINRGFPVNVKDVIDHFRDTAKHSKYMSHLKVLLGYQKLITNFPSTITDAEMNTTPKLSSVLEIVGFLIGYAKNSNDYMEIIKSSIVNLRNQFTDSKDFQNLNVIKNIQAGNISPFAIICTRIRDELDAIFDDFTLVNKDKMLQTYPIQDLITQVKVLTNILKYSLSNPFMDRVMSDIDAKVYRPMLDQFDKESIQNIIYHPKDFNKEGTVYLRTAAPISNISNQKDQSNNNTNNNSKNNNKNTNSNTKSNFIQFAKKQTISTSRQITRIKEPRKRENWTPEEEILLVKGYYLKGQGQWVKIKERYFPNRTNVQLKDKFRLLEKRNEGVWLLDAIEAVKEELEGFQEEEEEEELKKVEQEEEEEDDNFSSQIKGLLPKKNIIIEESSSSESEQEVQTPKTQTTPKKSHPAPPPTSAKKPSSKKRSIKQQPPPVVESSSEEELTQKSEEEEEEQVTKKQTKSPSKVTKKGTRKSITSSTTPTKKKQPAKRKIQEPSDEESDSGNKNMDIDIPTETEDEDEDYVPESEEESQEEEEEEEAQQKQQPRPTKKTKKTHNTQQTKQKEAQKKQQSTPPRRGRPKKKQS